MENKILTWSTRSLAAIAALALASSGECQPIFLFVSLSFFVLGIWIERYPELRRFMGMIQPVLAGLVLIVGLIDFFFLSNSFLLSIAHFLLSIQSVGLLALRTRRENLG